MRNSLMICTSVLSLCLIVVEASAFAEDAAVREGRIRAATMYYLSRFVQWPAESFVAPDSAIQICVAGEDTATEFFEATFQGKMVGKRTLSVRLVSLSEDAAQLSTCKILYFGEVAAAKIERTLQAVKELPVLTVSGSEDITTIPGGIVYLFVETNKLRIKINYQNSVHAKLQISAELLNVAVVVP